MHGCPGKKSTSVLERYIWGDAARRRDLERLMGDSGATKQTTGSRIRAESRWQGAFALFSKGRRVWLTSMQIHLGKRRRVLRHEFGWRL